MYTLFIRLTLLLVLCYYNPKIVVFSYSILMNCDSFKPFLGVRGWIFKDILPDLTLTCAECNVRRATLNNAVYRTILSAQVILLITCVDLH